MGKDPENQRLGKMARRKGQEFERQCAKDFRKLGFPDARRHFESRKEAAEMGIDLENTGNWRVQCKKARKYVPVNTINQINAEGIHLLLASADHEETMAVMRWSDLQKILNDIGIAYEGME